MIAFPQLGHAGRLGNQLWQIASTTGIAARDHRSPAFPDTWAYRDVFSVPTEWLIGPRLQYRTDVTELTTALAHIAPEARLYLQDMGLWAHIELRIAQLFCPSVAAAQVLHDPHAPWAWYYALPRPLTAVHVRRGDYLHHPDHHPVPSVDYYTRAIAAHAGESVVVFSDDLAWCRAHFGDAVQYFEVPAAYVPPVLTSAPRDWIDFFAMSAADAFVISNSTFSWWAAWLAQTDAVIYPEPWFGPALAYIDPKLMFSHVSWTPYAA